MHALIMDTQRVASLLGVHEIGYPESLWATHEPHRADLQDLAFNETWFFVEGVLWALLARAALGRPRDRRRWTMSAVAGVGLATCAGLLSAFGVTPRWTVG
jgi:hypothetical protein